METIRLQSVKELTACEKLPRAPKLVKRYLDTKTKQAEGKHFRIVIDKKSSPKNGAGIAYSNALRIEKSDGDAWSQVYSTGMMQYRGAYNYEIDDWDLSLSDPTIFEESESEVIYALSTGDGNVKVYHFCGNQPKLFNIFNVRNLKAIQERIKLLRKVVDDAETFNSFVKEGLQGRWSIVDMTMVNDGDAAVLVTDRADRDYDAISDMYRVHVWVKGKGIGETKAFPTGLCHPGGKFYRVGIGFTVKVVDQSADALTIAVAVKNSRQQWEESRDFRITRK